MSSIGKHPSLEPERTHVERAIAAMLEIAQSRGISASDFVQLLDSGMKISDFLRAIDGNNGWLGFYCDTVQ